MTPDPCVVTRSDVGAGQATSSARMFEPARPAVKLGHRIWWHGKSSKS